MSRMPDHRVSGDCGVIQRRWIAASVLAAAAATVCASSEHGVTAPISLGQVIGAGGAGVGGVGGGSGGTRSVPAMSVSFGHENSMTCWPNRWTPITVTLAAPAGVTGVVAGTFEGRVVVSYPQEGTVRAEVSRAVVCTPGKVSTFHVMVNVSRGASDYVVRLLDKRNREVARQIYTSSGGGDRFTFAIPDLTGSGRAVALGVGEPGMASAARSIAYATDLVQGHSAFGTSPVFCMPGSATNLPMSWAGYDSLLLLAVDANASGSLDPRVTAGIREWVSSGGRLVVFVNQPGTAWETWVRGLSGSDAGAGAEATDGPLMVMVEDPVVGPMPREIAGVLAAPVAKLRNERERAMQNFSGDFFPPPPEEAGLTGSAGDADPKNEVQPTPAPTAAPTPAQSATQRRITVTPAGEAAGWRVRWTDFGPAAEGTGDTSRGAHVGTSGLIAEGPMGFGWMVVVGVDPALLSAAGGAEATRAAWGGITERVLRDWRERGAADSSSNASNYGFYEDSPSMSVPSSVSWHPKGAILNRLADVPRLSNGIFIALAGGLFVLAVLIGPVDALVLRRLRARQHSWATSLVWIFGASMLAYWLPMVLRSGPTRVNRVSVVDVVMPAGVGVDQAVLAWSSGHTGVYASRTSRSSLTDRTQPAGSWWRGSSAQWYMPYAQRGRAGLVVNSFGQSLPDFSSLSPGAKIDGEGAGGNVLLPGTFRVWTFRMFSDQGRVSWPIGVTLDSTSPAPGGLAASVSGLPLGATVLKAAVCIRGTWYTQMFDTPAAPVIEPGAESGAVELALTETTGDAAERTWLGPAWNVTRRGGSNANSDPYGYNYRYNAPIQTMAQPGVCFDVAGPDRRSMIVHEICDGGTLGDHWAVVFLHLRGLPTGLSFSEQAQYSHDTLTRVLVPISKELAARNRPMPAVNSGSSDAPPKRVDEAPAENREQEGDEP